MWDRVRWLTGTSLDSDTLEVEWKWNGRGMEGEWKGNGSGMEVEWKWNLKSQYVVCTSVDSPKVLVLQVLSYKVYLVLPHSTKFGNKVLPTQ